MIKDTSKPAFPTSRGAFGAGMTLRDYFAAKAMEGIYASNTEHDHANELIFKVVAMASYEQADAMLEARKGGAA